MLMALLNVIRISWSIAHIYTLGRIIFGPKMPHYNVSGAISWFFDG